MKLTIARSRNPVLLAAVALCAAGMMTVQAQSTRITFSVDMSKNIADSSFVPGTSTIEAHGSFNGWGALTLVQSNSTTVYTNTANDTSDANGGKAEYKFVINGSNYENPATYGHNRAAHLPATSGASLVLPTVFFGDAGDPVTSTVTFQVDMSQQVNLGNFTPGTSVVEVQGKFNGWASGPGVLSLDPTIVQTNQFGLKSTNVYTGTFSASGSPGGADQFKFVIQSGNYEVVNNANNYASNDGDHNRYFSDSSQTLPIYFFSDNPYAPVVSNITFSVDMSLTALLDTNMNPASITVNGDLMGWGGVAMTNNPLAANTNLYTVVGTYNAGVGSSVNYQYRYTHLSDGVTVYDHFDGVNGGNNNRLYVVANVLSTNVVSFFNDATNFDDYLTLPTPVFFSVDMNGASGHNNDTHVFDPSVDSVYLNGQFANWYAWASGVNPLPAPGSSPTSPGGPYLMVEQGLTTIYTNTIIVPAGTPVAFNYKYGMDAGNANGGPSDDEAGVGQNHYRVVRATALNPYVLPIDTFGTMYGEPFFSANSTGGANLSVGKVTAGKVPVTWLGRPGAILQVKTDLASGTWQNLVTTDGTNWTTGYSSTNGFVSQTNWPAGSKAFFRVLKR